MFEQLKFKSLPELADIPKTRAIKRTYTDGRVEYMNVSDEEAFQMFCACDEWRYLGEGEARMKWREIVGGL